MNDDLHGNAPDSHPVALLLVDVINPCDFPEAADFLRLPCRRPNASLR